MQRVHYLYIVCFFTVKGLAFTYSEVESIAGSMEEIKNKYLQLNSSIASLSDALDNITNLCTDIVVCVLAVPFAPDINLFDEVMMSSSQLVY